MKATELKLVDTTTIKVTKSVTLLPSLGIAATPDGTKLYLSTLTQETEKEPSSPSITVVDAESAKVLTTIPMTSTQGHLAVSRDGRTLYPVGGAPATSSQIQRQVFRSNPHLVITIVSTDPASLQRRDRWTLRG